MTAPSAIPPYSSGVCTPKNPDSFALSRSPRSSSRVSPRSPRRSRSRTVGSSGMISRVTNVRTQSRISRSSSVRLRSMTAPYEPADSGVVGHREARSTQWRGDRRSPRAALARARDGSDRRDHGARPADPRPARPPVVPCRRADARRAHEVQYDGAARPDGDRGTPRLLAHHPGHHRSAAGHAGERINLHAGGVADERRRVLALVGPSGTGKTTATLALARRLGYVSDETVSIDPAGRSHRTRSRSRWWSIRAAPRQGAAVAGRPRAAADARRRDAWPVWSSCTAAPTARRDWPGSPPRTACCSSSSSRRRWRCSLARSTRCWR